jgi:cell division protein ZapA
MSDIAEIMIGGRRFRLQCGPGEMTRLQQLAKLVDQCASSLIQGQRGMGEEKVLLLSSLMRADHLEEARSELERLRTAQSRSRSVTQDRLALVLATAARRLDAVAAEIERGA